MLRCPCECNSGGFCGGCGHAGCSGGINIVRAPRQPDRKPVGGIVQFCICEVEMCLCQETVDMTIEEAQEALRSVDAGGTGWVCERCKGGNHILVR